MEKKNFFSKYIFKAVLGLSLVGAVLVGCKDYDDDIKNLQNQINELEGDVEGINTAIAALQTQIGAARVVTNVAISSDGKGINVTWSTGTPATSYIPFPVAPTPAAQRYIQVDEQDDRYVLTIPVDGTAANDVTVELPKYIFPVTSLSFIPEFSAWEGGANFIPFVRLSYYADEDAEEAGEALATLDGVTEIAYMVSPSNAVEGAFIVDGFDNYATRAIQKGNLELAWNVREEDGYKDGILTIEATYVSGANEEGGDVIALRVQNQPVEDAEGNPLPGAKKSLVTSEYVNVYVNDFAIYQDEAEANDGELHLGWYDPANPDYPYDQVNHQDLKPGNATVDQYAGFSVDSTINLLANGVINTGNVIDLGAIVSLYGIDGLDAFGFGDVTYEYEVVDYTDNTGLINVSSAGIVTFKNPTMAYAGKFPIVKVTAYLPGLVDAEEELLPLAVGLFKMEIGADLELDLGNIDVDMLATDADPEDLVFDENEVTAADLFAIANVTTWAEFNALYDEIAEFSVDDLDEETINVAIAASAATDEFTTEFSDFFVPGVYNATIVYHSSTRPDITVHGTVTVSMPDVPTYTKAPAMWVNNGEYTRIKGFADPANDTGSWMMQGDLYNAFVHSGTDNDVFTDFAWVLCNEDGTVEDDLYPGVTITGAGLIALDEGEGAMEDALTYINEQKPVYAKLTALLNGAGDPVDVIEAFEVKFMYPVKQLASTSTEEEVSELLTVSGLNASATMHALNGVKLEGLKSDNSGAYVNLITAGPDVVTDATFAAAAAVFEVNLAACSFEWEDATTLPSGLELDEVTGEITWTKTGTNLEDDIVVGVKVIITNKWNDGSVEANAGLIETVVYIKVTVD